MVKTGWINVLVRPTNSSECIGEGEGQEVKRKAKV